MDCNGVSSKTTVSRSYTAMKGVEVAMARHTDGEAKAYISVVPPHNLHVGYNVCVIYGTDMTKEGVMAMRDMLDCVLKEWQ